MMSQALRKLTGVINKSNTTVIFINQLREKVGVMFGSPETTTGGKALKFYASVRLDVRRKTQSKMAQTLLETERLSKLLKTNLRLLSKLLNLTSFTAKAFLKAVALLTLLSMLTSFKIRFMVLI